MLRIRVLGKLELELDGELLRMPPGRLRALLAWLVLHPGLRDRGEVAGSLWPDVLDESARASLRGALALLRRELGATASGCLVASRTQLGLAPEAWVDVREFERLVAAGRPDQALALVRGELLEGLTEDWVYTARDQQRDRVIEVLERLAADAEAAGDLAAATTRTREVLSLDPLSERGHRELIRRLAAAGDRAGALAAYERARERLARELGMAPSADTRQLVEEIRRGSPSAPPPAAPIARATRLPVPGALGRAHRSPLVGRGAALERLRSTWELAQRDRALLVLLGGEAGIGKTRVVSEFAAQLHAEGAIVLYGRAAEEPLAPFQPFAEALRPYVAATASEQLASQGGPLGGELARLLPDQASRLPAEHDRSERDPEGARLRLFEATAALLASAARSAPVLLVMDDVHWADRPTLMLLRHVVRAAPASMLVVCMCREGELGPEHALIGTLADLRRDGCVERLSLGGLVPDQVRSLVEAWLGATAPGLADALCEESGGNPFFIEELLRHIEERGGPSRDDRRQWLGLPEGVKDVVRARLGRLGSAVADVLRMAAVAGREFDLSTLGRVAGIAPDELVASLDAALASQLIRESGPPGSFTFNHALVREAIYDELSSARRALLHARIGEAIEQGPEPPAARLPELAGHFLLAGPERAVQAVEYARRAGLQAASQLAYEAAAGWFERALDAMSGAQHGVAPASRATVLLDLGDALLRAGDVAGSRERFSAAATLAREIADPRVLARAALGRSGLSVTVLGVDHENVALLEEALSRLDDGEHGLRAQLLGRLAIEVYYEPPASRREKLSASALELARAASAPGALADALSARHVALWSAPHLFERLALAGEMVALGERSGDRERVLQGRNWRFMDVLESGDVAAARRELELHAGLADELRLPGYQWWAPMWSSTLALMAGSLEEAAELRARALEIGRSAGDRVAELFAWIQDFYSRWERADGELDGPPQEVAVTPVQSALRSDLPLLLVEAGRRDEAQTELAVLAAGHFESVPNDLNWLASLAGLSQAAAVLEDRKRASELYELLAPYRSRAIVVGRAAVCLGPAELYLGMLAGTIGELGAATAHLDAATAWSEAAGAELWAAWAGVQRARVLLGDGRRAESSPPTEALVAARAAQSRAERLGLGRVARHARALLRRGV